MAIDMDAEKFESAAYKASKYGAIGAIVGSIIGMGVLGSIAPAAGTLGGLIIGVMVDSIQRRSRQSCEQQKEKNI